jgi:hypothetical protein
VCACVRTCEYALRKGRSQFCVEICLTSGQLNTVPTLPIEPPVITYVKHLFCLNLSVCLLCLLTTLFFGELIHQFMYLTKR